MRAASPSFTLVGAVLLVAGVSLAALAGCAASRDPEPSPRNTTPAAEPVFASDEEALAAAEKAYAAYLAVDNRVGQSGGESEFAYAEVAAGEALDNALANAKQFRDARAHTTGETKFRTVDLQSAEYGSANEVSISFYICDDLSDVELIGEDGRPISANEINPSAPFLVTVTSIPSLGLKVSTIDSWSGDDYCVSP